MYSVLRRILILTAAIAMVVDSAQATDPAAVPAK
jgi:hypothetical protein